MKNIPKKLVLVACIQGLLGFQTVYAATYYVSPSGVETNTGTSLSAPVKTIKNALSKANASGDIVYVMTGTYAEAVYIGQSGITLSAYSNNKPVIDGGTTLPNKDWSALLSVVGDNNIVSGFEVKNSNITGAYAGGYGVVMYGHHNTVSKMNVHHSWETGVYMAGDYNIFEDSTISQNAFRNSTNSGQVTQGWAMGFSAGRNDNPNALIPKVTSYGIFRRNTVYNNWGEGAGSYNADHMTFEDNVIYDNWTINLYNSNSSNVLVQRNLVYVSSVPAIPTRNNTPPSGISIAEEDNFAPFDTNPTIINNLVYNTGISAFSWTEVNNTGLTNALIANNTIIDGDLSTGAGGTPFIVNKNSQIRNNIILGKGSNVPSSSGITFSNNNWSVIPPLGKSTTDVVGDPKIARTGTTAAGSLTKDYFKVLASSPVIDAGIPLKEIAVDFFKVARGTAPDIGAYEFSSSSTSVAPAPVAPAPVTPAPVTPAPVTPAPVTPAPVIPAPVIPAPVIPAPVIPAPVIPAPVTPAPVTPAPVIPAPVIPAPVTPAPVTPAPVIPAPVTPTQRYKTWFKKWRENWH